MRTKKHGGKRKGSGRKPLPSGEARDVRLALRLTREQAESYQRAADRDGLTVSQWIREVADHRASFR